MKDIKAIHTFIARDSRYYADAVVVRLLSTEAKIGLYPEAGTMIRECPRKDIRQVKHWSYRVIYRIISDNQIDILTVIHEARDWNFDLPNKR